jgi:hypothetical protein
MVYTSEYDESSEQSTPGSPYENNTPILDVPLLPVNLRFAYIGGQSRARFGYKVPHDDASIERCIPSDGYDEFDEGTSSYDGNLIEHDGVRRNEEKDMSTSDDDDIVNEEHQSIDRIRECIEYTHRHLTENPGQNPPVLANMSTTFRPKPSPACKMLRAAAQAGIAQLAWSSQRLEIYTLGAPPSVAPIGLSEHWWVGLDPAQIRAGPGAEDSEVRRAEGVLRQMNTRQQKASKNKNGRLNLALRKAEEGLRRQEQGLPMCESDDEMSNDVEMLESPSSSP